MARGVPPVRHLLVLLGLTAICETGSAHAVPTASLPATPPPAYQDPAPIRIYRFHVYSTMKSRSKKTVTIDTLVSTSGGGVAMGDQGVLERMLAAPKGGSDWAPVAKVVVTKLLAKGRVQVEIQSEEAEAKVKRGGKLPYAPGQKVRLQIDRVLS